MNPEKEQGLRFAVLLDEGWMTSWQVECISLLVKSGLCHLELMITLMPAWRKRVFFRGYRVLRHSLWFAFVATLGRAKTNKKATGNPFSVSNLTISVPEAKDGFLVAIPEFSSVRERGLDFILNFGSSISGAAVAGLAHYGVWTFRFGDPSRSDEYPPVFWEMFQREAVSCVTLEQYTNDGKTPGTVLRRGFFPVTPHSYARSLDVALLGSVDFPLLACQKLFAKGDRAATALSSDG